jgi:hypothetical protein
MKLDAATKNATIWILVGFDLLFFFAAIAAHVLAVHWPTLNDLAGKVWTVFMAANGSVLLALSIDSKGSGEGKHDDSLATDGSPANPTK